ncbi:hypothetical protein NKH77_23650 [Streptomyces sp. M19]
MVFAQPASLVRRTDRDDRDDRRGPGDRDDRRGRGVRGEQATRRVAEFYRTYVRDLKEGEKYAARSCAARS